MAFNCKPTEKILPWPLLTELSASIRAELFFRVCTGCASIPLSGVFFYVIEAHW